MKAFILIFLCVCVYALGIAVGSGKIFKVKQSDKVIFMQGCIADNNLEYQCILMWKEHSK